MLNFRFTIFNALIVLGFTSASYALPAAPPQISSELSGVVHDEQGRPLVGAVVSVFGRNLAQGARVAVTDDEGRFEVVDVPPGLYRLRAYLEGFLPSDYAKVLVQAGVEAAGSILMSLASASGESEPEDEAESIRTAAELQWLLRHAERNILRDADETVSVASLDLAPSSAPEPGFFADVGGEFGVMAGTAGRDIDEFPAAGAGLDGRLAFAHLTIPTKQDGYWLVSAQLLESALSSWAGRAEFVDNSMSGHEVSTGVTYGKYLYGDVEGFRPPEAGLVQRQGQGDIGATEWFGSIFARDTFSLGDAQVTAGLDYRHFSYLSQAGYASPSLAVSYPIDSESKTVVRGEMDYQLQAPGGEDMSLLSEMVYHDVYGPSLPQQRELRAERTQRFQLGVEQRLGEATSVTLRVFQENAADQLVRVYSKNLPVNGGAGYYAMGNQGDFETRGLGLSFSQRFGATQGTVGYNFGTARALTPTLPAALARDSEIHDVTTRVSTSIDRTRTRVRAAYRLTRHPILAEGRPGFASESSIDSRFDIQVYQMLPFVGWNGTRWELMVAVRSLFYEDTEGVSLLDEMSVIDAPKRVLGGVSVRF